jgi:hypothetical protein
MHTLILPYSETDTEILSFIDRLRRTKKVFKIDDDDTLRNEAIRERLRLKYVTTGEWAVMDDEDRQDASLLEGMLYDKEMGNVEMHSETDSKDFYLQLKKELNAV